MPLRKMADFGGCQKSSQTPRNVTYMLRNGFLIVLGLVRSDLGGILKGPKSADFMQKAWAIAHSFAENGGFWWVPEIASNSLKRRLYASKWISYCFETSS